MANQFEPYGGDAGQRISNMLLGFAATINTMKQQQAELASRERIHRETMAIERERFQIAEARQQEELKLAKTRESRFAEQFAEEKRQWQAQVAEKERTLGIELRLKGFQLGPTGKLEDIPEAELTASEKLELQRRRMTLNLEPLKVRIGLLRAQLSGKEQGGGAAAELLNIMAPAKGSQTAQKQPWSLGGAIGVNPPVAPVPGIGIPPSTTISPDIENLLNELDTELKNIETGGGLEAVTSLVEDIEKKKARERGEAAQLIQILDQEIATYNRQIVATTDPEVKKQLLIKKAEAETRRIDVVNRARS